MKKIIFFLTVAALIAWLALGSNGTIAAGRIRTARVSRADMCEFIKLRGKVELGRRASLYARTAGVLAFDIKEGDALKAGERAASIGAEDLLIARRGAEAAYKAAQARLDEAKNSVREEQLKQAEAQLEQAKVAAGAAAAEYEYRSDLYRKMTELTRSGSVSDQNRRDTKNLYDAAASAKLEAEKRVRIAEYGLRLLQKGSSEHVIKAAAHAVEQAKAALETIDNDIAKSDIIAPIDCVVLAKCFEPGSFVQPGALLFELGDTSSAYIRCDVLTDDIARIAVGRRAVISGDILGGGSFEAEVSYIAPRAFTKVSSLGVEQQKIEVRLSYDANKYAFRPGYEFDADIITRRREKALLVPYKAVFDRDGKNSVFVVENDRAALREIESGIENDDFIEIISGAAEGETVIVDPPNAVKPGIRITR